MVVNIFFHQRDVKMALVYQISKRQLANLLMSGLICRPSTKGLIRRNLKLFGVEGTPDAVTAFI